MSEDNENGDYDLFPASTINKKSVFISYSILA